MILQHLSESTEMYLKAIAEADDRDAVAVSRLADRLSVTTVSVNEMVHRLDEQGLVEHTPYKGVALTPKGREAASNILRRQRLWEVFLYEHLKIEWARVYQLACALEHATAPEVTEALSVFLGNPQVCPRGNPIPAADGSFKPLPGGPLSQVAVGRTVRVLAITATETDVLQYLQEQGLLPGKKITVLAVTPLHGPLVLRIVSTGKGAVSAKDVALGLSLAEFVIVR